MLSKYISGNLILGSASNDNELTSVLVRANDGTIKYRSTSSIAAVGIWGVADSSGDYTYYATYALALVQAISISAKCIELFADVTDAVESTKILTNGINVNLNGHTYTLTGTTTHGFSDNNVACTCQVYNGTIIKNVAGKIALLVNNPSSVITGNATIINTTATGYGIYSFGTTAYFSIIGSNCLYHEDTLATASFLNIQCTSGIAIMANYAGSVVRQCTVTSISAADYAVINNGLLTNCTITSNGFHAINNNGNGIVSNTISKSFTSLAVLNSGEVDNCTFISSASNAYQNSGSGRASNCKYVGVTTFAIRMIGGTHYNGLIEAKASACAGNAVLPEYFYDCIFLNLWNNTSGHGISLPETGTIVSNCTSILSNTSAYAVFSNVGTPTVYYLDNKLKGSSNHISTTIVQGQTNTADAVGNIIIN